MPRLEDWEIKKYWEIFQGLGPVDNKLTGERVSPVLKNSRLSDQQLSQIWDLSDIDSDGSLDFEEFCITMRLIFDLVNGTSQSIPSSLPSWLIPSSKAHLIQANTAVASGSHYNQDLDIEDDEDDDEEETLSDDFEWYIAPTDRSTYEDIYNSNCDAFGRVKFDSLQGLYKTLSKVPASDITSAWNLINPKSFEAIDKDQVMIFLHILNQRENGRRVPRYVPPSLRATFSKDVPSYDLNKPAAQPIKQTSKNENFAESYLKSIGHSSSKLDDGRGTDFSATEGTDWEEVRLRKELKNLEDQLAKASDNSSKASSEKLAMIKYEFEQLLKYKTYLLEKTKEVDANGKTIADVRNDVELIENQIQSFSDFLQERQKELEDVQKQIRELKS